MKKRLTCLLLCFVMLLSLALASCAGETEEEAKENIIDDASDTAITLTMWVVSEEKVEPEAANAVSKAINSITNSKFKTKLVLHFFTEEEYYGVIENKFVATETAKTESAAAQKEYKTYLKDQKAANNTDEAAIREDFLALHPEWVDYITTAPVTEENPEETEEAKTAVK